MLNLIGLKVVNLTLDTLFAFTRLSNDNAARIEQMHNRVAEDFSPQPPHRTSILTQEVSD